MKNHIHININSNHVQNLSSFQFEITFECIEDLPEDLEWKIIYVGSAESEEFDQVLDTVYVGPVPEGRHMFVFQVSADILYWFTRNIIQTLLLKGFHTGFCYVLYIIIILLRTKYDIHIDIDSCSAII